MSPLPLQFSRLSTRHARQTITSAIIEVHSVKLSTFQLNKNIKMIKNNQETLWSTNYFIIIMENLFFSCCPTYFSSLSISCTPPQLFSSTALSHDFLFLLFHEFHEFYFIFMRLIATYPHHTVQLSHRLLIPFSLTLYVLICIMQLAII